MDNSRVAAAMPIVLDILNLQKVKRKYSFLKIKDYFFQEYETSLSSMYEIYSIILINLSFSSHLVDGHLILSRTMTRI